ncbi:MAG: hypothetical protein ACPGYY_05715 [Bacteroidia bacterium]
MKISVNSGITMLQGDIASSLGQMIKLDLKKQYTSNLDVGYVLSIGTFKGVKASQVRATSYTFKNQVKSFAMSVGYNFYFMKNKRLRASASLASAVIWSNVNGNFYDQNEANKMYLLWGDSYFSPEYEYGILVDATVQYKGMNLSINPVISLGYQVSNKIEMGLSFTKAFTNTDNLDAYSFPTWSNNGLDSYTFQGVFIGYTL